MKDILRLSLTLMVIAAVAAGVLAMVSQKTAGPIARSLREERMRAVKNVLPEFDNVPDQDTVSVDSRIFYRARRDGRIVGTAFSVISHQGYGGDIQLMVGVDTSGVVRGVEVLKHLETPGLGAKIANQDFREQFKSKSLDNPATWKVKKDGGAFEAITGATISSRAVVEAIASGLEIFRNHRRKIFAWGRSPGKKSRKGGNS